MPRHGASCPVGLGVSCSADRNIVGKINDQGVFLEQLETNPGKYLPEVMPEQLGGDVIKVIYFVFIKFKDINKLNN